MSSTTRLSPVSTSVASIRHAPFASDFANGIVITHDMNSVMGIGENIIFIYEGTKEWQGVSSQVMGSSNKRLTDFIFASDLLKNMRQMVIDNGLKL